MKSMARSSREDVVEASEVVVPETIDAQDDRALDELVLPRECRATLDNPFNG